MTTPSTEDQFGGLATINIEIDPHEAATGGERTVVLPPGNRSVTIRFPAGVGDNSVVSLPGADLTNPSAPRDVLVRIHVRPAPFAGPAAPAPWPSVEQPVKPKSSGTRALLIGGIALAVILLLGCIGVFALSLGGNDDAGEPERTAVSAQEYQAALTAADAALKSAFQALAAGRNPATTGDAATALSMAAQTEHGKLLGLAPPAPVTAAHNQLTRALEQFTDMVSETAKDADVLRICAGVSAISKITNSEATTSLRAAVEALATADPANPYKVGSFLPATVAEQSRRLGNGTFVKKGTRNGEGQLKIENRGLSDTAVSLVPANTKASAITVYVTAGSNFTVNGVKDGTYQIFMTAGADWDQQIGGFTRNCSFQKFEDVFEFKTTSREATIWTISLKPVEGGNAPTDKVDPGEFPT